MFNFTTQTIFNSLSKWSEDNPKGNLIINDGSDDGTPYLRVGNLRFDAPNVVDVEKKLPSQEALSHVTFDISDFASEVTSQTTLTGKVTARFAFYVGLAQTSVDSFYANDLVYKGKPLYVEFPLTLAGWTDAEKATFKKVAKMVLTSDSPILNVTVDSNTVTFTCTNGYQILREAKLQVYDPAASTISCCEAEGGFLTLIEASTGSLLFEEESDEAILVPVEEDESGSDDEPVIVPGAEAFADYKWIMHNLRLPTCANTYYWSANKAELPVVDAHYIQYTIKLCADRENIGGMVVGEKTQSVTTHVLYVKNDIDVTELDAALATLLGKAIATTADSKLKGE